MKRQRKQKPAEKFATRDSKLENEQAVGDRVFLRLGESNVDYLEVRVARDGRISVRSGAGTIRMMPVASNSIEIWRDLS
jgi:hypothetical protein